MTNTERIHTREEIHWLTEKIYGDIPPRHKQIFLQVVRQNAEALLDEISSKVKALETLFVLEKQSILYLTTNPEDCTAYLSYAAEILNCIKEKKHVLH